MSNLAFETMDNLVTSLKHIGKEPPFRLLSQAVIKLLPNSLRLKCQWDALARPHYLLGVLSAADEAKRQGVEEISVIEFGVAGGNGLICLQDHSAAVEAETGVRISVYGFDSGTGLPDSCGDYRDHPDAWGTGDYPMDEIKLRGLLADRTRLILGPVAKTACAFADAAESPAIGFIAMDLDLYSSTSDALAVISSPKRRILRRVAMYFDDVNYKICHQFAGERLAITEFNKVNASVKIDRWHGIEDNRPFPEASWLSRMYVAHDLAAISRTAVAFRRERVERLDLV